MRNCDLSASWKSCRNPLECHFLFLSYSKHLRFHRMAHSPLRQHITSLRVPGSFCQRQKLIVPIHSSSSGVFRKHFRRFLFTFLCARDNYCRRDPVEGKLNSLTSSKFRSEARTYLISQAKGNRESHWKDFCNFFSLRVLTECVKREEWIKLFGKKCDIPVRS